MKFYASKIKTMIVSGSWTINLQSTPISLDGTLLEVSDDLVIIMIISKKDRQCKAGRGRLAPYPSEDPSPTLPTYRGKEEKGKIVEDKIGESN